MVDSHLHEGGGAFACGPRPHFPLYKRLMNMEHNQNPILPWMWKGLKKIIHEMGDHMLQRFR